MASSRPEGPARRHKCSPSQLQDLSDALQQPRRLPRRHKSVLRWLKSAPGGKTCLITPGKRIFYAYSSVVSSRRPRRPTRPPRSPQDGPRGSQESPKTASKAPRTTQDGHTKSHPPQEDPPRPPAGSQEAPRGFKMAPKTPKERPRDPRQPREAPKESSKPGRAQERR